MNSKYVLFPFDAVRPNKRIAIYGAGEIFTSFRKQIKALNYCEIAWVIDKNFTEILEPNSDNKAKDAVRISPLSMPWNEPDYIVIASIAFADEIEQNIMEFKGNLDNVIKVTQCNIIDESFKSAEYWDKRYLSGSNSGCGSYNHLAEFKANIINSFVNENRISSVLEFGCGDGNQLSLSNYPKYIGFDVSSTAINLCMRKFKSDKCKIFKLMSEYSGEKAELVLSLDVIYHLIEDRVYEEYMDRVFSSSSKYIIIYSSNSDLNNGQVSAVASHVKHRKFSNYIKEKFSDWKLDRKIDNQYGYNGNYELTSFSDFYIYVKGQG
jgi:SAM-dependent methyltransferase